MICPCCKCVFHVVEGQFYTYLKQNSCFGLNVHLDYIRTYNLDWFQVEREQAEQVFKQLSGCKTAEEAVALWEGIRHAVDSKRAV